MLFSHSQILELTRFPSASSVGRRVAVRGLESGNYDIWLHDTTRPRKDQFTFGRDVERSPHWSPTGKRLVFTSRPWSDPWRTERPDPPDMFLQPVDGSSNAIRLLDGPEDEGPTDWSRDGRFLLYAKGIWAPHGGGDAEIWYLKWDRDREEFEKIPFVQDPETQCCAKLSPDGRFVAYSSTETGRTEIWVSPFPERTTKWLVSNAGGRQPRWSNDGTEIFYVDGDTLVAVKVATTPTFSVGSKEKLFRSDSFLGSYLPQYDVTADGQRFVVAGRLDEDRPAAIRVVQNWYEEFRDREQD